MRQSIEIACRALVLMGTASLLSGQPAMAQRTEDAAAAESTPSQPTPPLPTAVRFDPAAMPDVVTPTPPLGLRYSALSTSETKALRRGFKLPLDALTNARSTNDLLRAANVAPLPDPNQPLLSVAKEASTKTNPFASERFTSFRVDPMRALGELLAAADGIDPTTVSTETSTDDPFAGDAAFAPSTEPSTTAADKVESPESADDPFASDADPFGGSEDPFGDF